MRKGRPLLLILSDRPEVREAAEGQKDRVEVCEGTDDRPADALLIRPDGHIAWAAGTDEPAETSAPTLRRSLEAWFGPAPEAAAPTAPTGVRAGELELCRSSLRGESAYCEHAVP